MPPALWGIDGGLEGKEMRKTFALLCCPILAAAFGCSALQGNARVASVGAARVPAQQTPRQSDPRPRPSSGSPFLDRLSEAAVERTSHEVRYDPTYFVIGYPGGDVPPEVGVCTDEVIRSYRALGVDLQQLVHEDMKSNFSLYPHKWGLKRPDTNIDHRRVPNLMVFFE